jgi:predicted AlkP superfamily pyrophosphatase or phosphodiesterase
MRVSPALWAITLLLPGFMPLSAAGAHKLVVISISGLDFRYLRDADRLHLKIPVLRRFMAQGAFADGVSGVPPTSSAAATATLITGVPPAGRTAIDNAVTLWQAAAKARLKTASLFWPGTVGAGIDFTCPEIRPIPFSGSVPFDPIAEKCTRGLVERISSVYPAFRKSTWNDETSMSGLSYLLQYEQPDLTLVQLVGLDEEQRETGALSLYSRDLLENDDELLGQMIARLPAHSVVAIVSDHGFETQEHIVRPRVLANSQAV